MLVPGSWPRSMLPYLLRTHSRSQGIPGNEYRYVVAAVTSDGLEIRSIEVNTKCSASPLTLIQNYPNPFNPSTTIKYNLPKNCPVLLEIFDVSGKRMATLVNESQEKGQYSVEWNGQDKNGNPVSSGTYFYRLKAGKEMISKKMVLLK